MDNALVWFRRDLRVADNPALGAALEAGLRPIPVYIHDPSPGRWSLGSASGWWLHKSLEQLDGTLRAFGSRLIIARGEAQTQLLRLCETFAAGEVFWNRLHEPRSRARDAEIDAALRARGVTASSFDAQLLCEPRELLKADDSPYRVFTPFWKMLQKRIAPRGALASPSSLPAFPRAQHQGLAVKDLKLLPEIPWYHAFSEHWQPGEAGAQRALERFLTARLADYPQDRDLPALTGTSRLSPHLHFGELSPQQAWHGAQQEVAARTAMGVVAASESWLRQLAWREFAHHLLYHFPETTDEPMDARFRAFPWRSAYAADLRRWQRGLTGFPIVDAGMRELWESGWMHNRVRMLAASFLTKNLLIPWQEGARWFWDTLVDADLANNTLGWQWTAGCGVDAAPYFRIFNPVRQGERFDPGGSYVRRWVPELENLSAEWIHQPWAAPGEVLHAAGVSLGGSYPQPMVDLQQSRRRALGIWERIKRGQK
jgi:deoxyribodipyrimidine photo-lyase